MLAHKAKDSLTKLNLLVSDAYRIANENKNAELNESKLDCKKDWQT
jgi:hypothetical protein